MPVGVVARSGGHRGCRCRSGTERTFVLARQAAARCIVQSIPGWGRFRSRVCQRCKPAANSPPPTSHRGPRAEWWVVRPGTTMAAPAVLPRTPTGNPPSSASALATRASSAAEHRGHRVVVSRVSSAVAREIRLGPCIRGLRLVTHLSTAAPFVHLGAGPALPGAWGRRWARRSGGFRNPGPKACPGTRGSAGQNSRCRHARAPPIWVDRLLNGHIRGRIAADD